MNPLKGTKRVHGVEQLDAGGETLALRVSHQYGEDTIRHAIGPSGGSFGMARHDDRGEADLPAPVWPGKHQRRRAYPLDTRTASRAYRGNRSGVLPQLPLNVIGTARPSARRPSKVTSPASETPDVPRHTTSRPWKAEAGAIASGSATTVSGSAVSSLRVGTRTEPASRRKPTFTWRRRGTTGAHGLRTGTTRTGFPLTTSNWRLTPRASAGMQAIRLVGGHDLSAGFGVGDIAFLYDVGPGDTIEVTPTATAVRQRDGRFRIRANCRAILD